MRWIFMDNFRGFSETFVRLASVSFLVGENSTGKSSFLALLQLFASPDFVIGLEFPTGGDSDLGGFKDIVSVASSDKSSFTVAMLCLQNIHQKTKRNSKEFSFVAMTFRDNDGLPKVSSYTTCQGERITTIRHGRDGLEYRVSTMPDYSAFTESDAKAFFIDWHHNFTSRGEFRTIPSTLPVRAPLPFVLSMLLTTLKGEPPSSDDLFSNLPLGTVGPISGKWLAPIRTRPRRIYEGVRTRFTPEGDHIPFVIRRTLGSGESSQKFTELIKRFGESSGLFKMVKAHSFGRTTTAPFEISVSLLGKELNIGNVGYGVSQVLPVVVEMLTAPRQTLFAIQQPEVHLHPRAQAALGDLIHHLAVHEDHKFVIETHSDYLIDRFRLRIKENSQPRDSQALFFQMGATGNHVHELKINQRGQYPEDQPKEFREFFINEEVSLLEI